MISSLHYTNVYFAFFFFFFTIDANYNVHLNKFHSDRTIFHPVVILPCWLNSCAQVAQVPVFFPTHLLITNDRELPPCSDSVVNTVCSLQREVSVVYLHTFICVIFVVSGLFLFGTSVIVVVVVVALVFSVTVVPAAYIRRLQ